MTDRNRSLAPKSKGTFVMILSDHNVPKKGVGLINNNKIELGFIFKNC